MAFTYMSSSPAAPARDRVRMLLSDTVNTTATPAAWQDAELDLLLGGAGGNPYLAAAAACDILAVRYAGQVDKSMGNASVSASQRSQAYADQALALRAAAATFARRRGAGVFAGGRHDPPRNTPWGMRDCLTGQVRQRTDCCNDNPNPLAINAMDVGKCGDGTP